MARHENEERSFTRYRGFRMTATTKSESNSKAKSETNSKAGGLKTAATKTKTKSKTKSKNARLKSRRPLQVQGKIQKKIQMLRAGGTPALLWRVLGESYAFSSQVSPARRSLARSPLPFLAITSRICC